MKSRGIMVAGLAVLVFPCLAWSGLPHQGEHASFGGLNPDRDPGRSGSGAVAAKNSVSVVVRSTPAIRVAQVEPPDSLTGAAPADSTVSRPDFVVPTHVVNTPALNVRFSPDTGDRIAVILYRGDEVQLLEERGSWSHLAYDSKGVVRTGWALSRLIVDRSAAAELQPAQDRQSGLPPAATVVVAETKTPPLITGAPLDQASRPEAITPTHVVAAEALRVRFTPNTDSRIAVILYSGDDVQVLESTGGWSKVAYDSRGVVRTGWAVSRLLADRDGMGPALSQGADEDFAIARQEDQPVSRPVVSPVVAESEPEIPPLVTSEPLPAAQPATPATPAAPSTTEPAPAPVAPSAPVTASIPVTETVPAVPSTTEPAPAPVAPSAPITAAFPETAPAPVMLPDTAVELNRIVPTHIVGANPLRLRLRPEASAEIAVVLTAGEQVQLLESAGEWTRIAYKADGVIRTGWVASGLIVERGAGDRGRPAPATATGAIAASHIVVSEAARVRFTPDTGEPVAAELYAGDSVRLLEEAGRWSNIAYELDGVTRTGWVLSRLIVERQPPETSGQPKPDAPATYGSAPVGGPAASTSTTSAPIVPSYRLVTTHIVQSTMAQVRLEPSFDAGVRDVLPQGHKMRKLQASGAWTRIAYHSDGVTRSGWLLSSMIKEL